MLAAAIMMAASAVRTWNLTKQSEIYNFCMGTVVDKIFHRASVV